MAWHAGPHNSDMLGVELVQPRKGDTITNEQYKSLAWWLKNMSARFGFPLTLDRLPEHKDTAQGIVMGKSDVGWPYSYDILKTYL